MKLSRRRVAGPNSAAITGVSPSSGIPGTQITITGSGFGSSQGTGQVWLGTASGVVQSWSDTQVIALVGAGASSGNTRLSQAGVMSTGTWFAVNTPQLAASR